MKKRFLFFAIPLALLATGLLVAFSGGGTSVFNGAATPSATAEAVQSNNHIVAEGKVLPIRHAALSFPSGGTIAAVLVAEGERVQAGQVLARLDSARPAAAVAQAEAARAEARAAYQKLRVGATAQEIAQAEAQLHQAKAQLQQTNGSVTRSDLRAAEAAVQQAQAQLNQLLAGPKAVDRQASAAQLQQTQANLQTQRDQLSAAKTNAQLDLTRATAALTQAQAAYATALKNWQYIQDSGKDPVQPQTAQGKPNKLNDTQRQQYYTVYVQAEAAMHSAEQAVTQAQVVYDAARQAEITGIQIAEQQVAQMQASYDKLMAGAEADQIAAARAQLAAAQANLERLRGDTRAGSLAAAQAGVEQAQAGVEQLRSGATPNDLAIAQAQVQSAEAALQFAQVALDEMELRAPFDGTIAALDLRPGEFIAPGQPVVQIADIAAWQIETTDLTELNVTPIKLGDSARLTFDALPELELAGKVSQIKAYGENRQGDITYTVTVVPDRQDTRLRWNMTATITLESPAKR